MLSLINGVFIYLKYLLTSEELPRSPFDSSHDLRVLRKAITLSQHL
jgi:hypothetical protein